MRVDTSSGKGRAKDGRMVVVGGGIVVLALLVILLGGGLSADEFLTAGLMSLRNGVMRSLAQDVSPTERLRLHSAFGCVISRAGSHAVADEELGAFARACRRAMADGRIDRNELRTLSEAGEGLCRRAARGGS